MILLKLTALALVAVAMATDSDESRSKSKEDSSSKDSSEEDSKESLLKPSGGPSSILGMECSFINGHNRVLYQFDDKNTNSTIQGVYSIEEGFEKRATWKIIRWTFDGTFFYEIQNDDSNEYLSVENYGTAEKDDFGVVASPFQFLNKSPSNLWQLEEAPFDTYRIKHKDSNLYLNLEDTAEDENMKAILEADPKEKWTVKCEREK